MTTQIENQELMYNVLYHLTGGAEGVQTIPCDLTVDALRVQIRKGNNEGFTPNTFLRPSDGDMLKLESLNSC